MREWWRRQVGPNLPYWIAFWVWVGMVGGVIGRVVALPPDQGSVVPIYLTAGERWLASELLHEPIPDLDKYTNPPGVAALFAPLSGFDPKSVAVLWRLVNIAFYATGIRGLIRLLLPAEAAWRACGVWVVSAILVIPSFNNGQINLTIVALAVCGAVAISEGRWWLAAASFAVSGYMKLYPFAIGLLMCVEFPRPLAWRFWVMTVAVVAFPFLTQRPQYAFERHVEFVQVTLKDDRTETDFSRVPRDWTFIYRGVTGTPVPRLIAIAVSLVAAAGTVVVVHRQRREYPQSVLTPLAFGLVWITLFGPLTEMNTYSVLAPVAAVFSFALPDLRSLERWKVWLGTGGLFVVELKVALVGTGGFDLSWCQPIAAGLLGLAVVGWAWKKPAGSGTGGI